eukprot:TRINITY_DN15469_c0_g1_i2.p1 TRINITY_DN15469_c0_g1~~TRINITY_DN15469_c0_g1_i2.p1  ORF type:complete len:140 (-),score=3.76 TRINITY_DN15469_c0_g1_i2:127-546(-)
MHTEDYEKYSRYAEEDRPPQEIEVRLKVTPQKSPATACEVQSMQSLPVTIKGADSSKLGIIPPYTTISGYSQLTSPPQAYGYGTTQTFRQEPSPLYKTIYQPQYSTGPQAPRYPGPVVGYTPYGGQSARAPPSYTWKQY